ncbi:MAG TPA: Uma2 family endonuclease [Chloroflexota bacterium]|nr:Uma2 family endonuclease [Chloroflexota bacterium]
MAQTGVSLAEFLARPETDPPEEYVDGAVVRKPPLAERERWLRSDLATLLFGWARASHQGAAALAVRCVLGGDVYVPDVEYIAPGRLPASETAGGALSQPPDLAVEICPATVDPAWVAAKVARYLACGVRCAWLVDPAEETVAVYGPGAAPVTLGRGEVLEGGALLPGFYVHLDDLFDTLQEEPRESS